MVNIVGLFDDLVNQIASNPIFESLGIFFIFIFTIIPSAKSIPVEIFSFPLLQSGVSPVLLILMAWLGAITGDYILYLAGRGLFHVFKRKSKELASADHLLHKYRYIFLATPYLGLIGDTVVFVAGVERIGFKKILPFIVIGHLSRFTIGMLALLGVVQLPEFLGI